LNAVENHAADLTQAMEVAIIDSDKVQIVINEQ